MLYSASEVYIYLHNYIVYWNSEIYMYEHNIMLIVYMCGPGGVVQGCGPGIAGWPHTPWHLLSTSVGLGVIGGFITPASYRVDVA